MTRTRGITVRTFDARRTEDDRPSYGYAYAVGPDGTHYVICTEGVGWVVSDDTPLIVDTFAGGYELPLFDVQWRAAAGTDVDLADHVRTFGDRLDCNHASWVRRLTPVPAPVADRIPEVMSGWCDYCRRYNRPCGRHES